VLNVLNAAKRLNGWNGLNGQSFLELLNFEPPQGVKRFELSEAVELLERLEPVLFAKHQGSQSPRGKKGNKEKFSQERLCLLTPAS
jgi:hypothetical protein